MKPIGLFSQIAAVALAAAIVVFFVYPKVTEIGVLQNQIAEYETERQKIADVNSKLTQRLADLEAISPTNRERILTYMPPFIDEISVLRDLEIIAQNVGIIYTDLAYAGEVELPAELLSVNDQLAPVLHGFDMSVVGSYDVTKDFLSLLEQHKYPLQVYQATMQEAEGGLLNTALLIVTYVDDQDNLNDV